MDFPIILSCSTDQSAAGVLNYIRETLLPLIQLSAEDHDPPSPDLSKSTLSALSSLCLAQAQECVFQRALADGLKNGSVARIAQKVSELYDQVLTNASEARGAGGVWPTFSFPSVSTNAIEVHASRGVEVAALLRTGSTISHIKSTISPP